MTLTPLPENFEWRETRINTTKREGKKQQANIHIANKVNE